MLSLIEINGVLICKKIIDSTSQGLILPSRPVGQGGSINFPVN